MATGSLVTCEAGLETSGTTGGRKVVRIMANPQGSNEPGGHFPSGQPLFRLTIKSRLELGTCARAEQRVTHAVSVAGADGLVNLFQLVELTSRR